jgi:hypothetical protein
LKTFLILIFALFLSQLAFSQSSKTTFYPDANGTVYGRKQNHLALITEHSLDTFFYTFKKRYGSPIRDLYPPNSTCQGLILIYKCYNPHWSKDQIIIKIEPSTSNNLDNTTDNNLDILVETKHKVDLLNHSRTSYKRIENYFKALLKTLYPDLQVAS